VRARWSGYHAWGRGGGGAGRAGAHLGSRCRCCRWVWPPRPRRCPRCWSACRRRCCCGAAGLGPQGHPPARVWHGGGACVGAPADRQLQRTPRGKGRWATEGEGRARRTWRAAANTSRLLRLLLVGSRASSAALPPLALLSRLLLREALPPPANQFPVEWVPRGPAGGRMGWGVVGWGGRRERRCRRSPCTPGGQQVGAPRAPAEGRGRHGSSPARPHSPSMRTSLCRAAKATKAVRKRQMQRRAAA